MTAKEEYQILEARKVEVDSKFETLSSENFELCEKMDSLKCKIIFEEGLLANINTWEVKISAHGFFSLHYFYDLDSSDPIYAFKNLVFTDYDSHFNFSEDIHATLHDNELYILFDSIKCVAPFVQKYGLKINGGNFFERIQKLKEELLLLETLQIDLKATLDFS